MAKQAPQKPSLSEYETAQVERIAAWKGAYPNPVGELLRRTALPVARVVEKLIPNRLALASIDAAYRAAMITSGRPDQGRDEEATKTSSSSANLEDCDRQSRMVGTFAQGIGTVEGAFTGAGGVWTTVLDIPLLFTLCLRTILKIGHCYGFALNQPRDKAWVLGAFAVALSSTRERRVELIAKLRDIEDLVLEQTEEQVVVEEAAALITQIEVFEDIPVFGAVTGALLNLSVVHKTDVTARRLFQERWLRTAGKIDAIEPVLSDNSLPSNVGWAGAFARLVYSTTRGVSFVAALPVCLITGATPSHNRSAGAC